MSELQRSFARAKLAGLPFEPPIPINDLSDEEDQDGLDELRPLPERSSLDDDSSSASSASSASSTGTIRPSPKLYFKTHRPHETVTYHVYVLPPEEKGPLLVTHHGAGSSGLSFALFASEIRKIIPKCGILSLDARGHGETSVIRTEPEVEDENIHLTLEILSQDLLEVIHLTQKHIGWPQLPDLVLIGHSLGGAVVTDLALSGRLGAALLGYAVLDVVEGSAIDALQSMQQYLLKRPNSFTSTQAAIEWHIRSRTIRSQTSARISVPSLLRQVSTSSTSGSGPNTTSFVWRTNLSETERYWSEWFTGLSSKFLSAKGGKLLILAGTDRLDKELMIGQMQGKYQLQVFPEAGHFVHEDCAAKTAQVMAEFVRRNDRSGLVLPPKVGDMLKA
ncbi:uncharacterized protein KY384_008336 [Bacidia gigantensis]|uniref:uncharacterized protein n=1 Tax=Bacidia gigantensis TaxID=2732470 RepID=UPI001D05A4DC|nr:uncharacterized protein KY384_008336 [Bacidia gigantensis]KAG8526907.1 hypothetical protein KY384_008336 [Bacidia gigantensis]